MTKNVPLELKSGDRAGATEIAAWLRANVAAQGHEHPEFATISEYIASDIEDALAIWDDQQEAVVSIPRLDPPLEGQRLQEVIFGQTYDADDSRYFTDKIEQANLITSLVAGTTPPQHKVVIDLDLPAKLIPSTTEGHFHLYIDKAMEEGEYMNLLQALENAGIIEPGYMRAAERRRYTAVRLPWVPKLPRFLLDPDEDNS